MEVLGFRVYIYTNRDAGMAATMAEVLGVRAYG